jgi:hypothetical protein
MMRTLVRTKWLFLALLIGLAVVTIKLPPSASEQALADGPPTTDGVQVAEAETGPLVVPPLTDSLAEESGAHDNESPSATAQLDTSTQGTY